MEIKNNPDKIKELNKKKVIVIFLHGLLSTDLGTFDVIIKQLNLLKDENIIMYGYPHNTLASIDSNADDLADLISTLFKDIKKPIPTIYFVCHSRGGLVARSTSVKLYNMSDKYKQTIKQAITFGTPHEGSELAEKSADLIALYVAYVFYKADGFLHNFGELLELLGEPKKFEGIENLKPRGQNPDNFIEKLRKEEKDQTKGKDKNRHLIIKAVGGKANEGGVPDKDFVTRKMKSFSHYLVNRIMNEENHDLVVRTESSVNSVIGLDIIETWNCNHFQYFQEENSEKLKFVSELIAQELKKKIVKVT